MTVNALYDYKFEARDKVENFNGMQLLYVYWPDHLMFCAPFALLVQPDMSFRALVDDHQTGHRVAPGFCQGGLSAGAMAAERRAFIPNADASLIDNGIDHKSMLTVTTPGLDGMANVGYRG